MKKRDRVGRIRTTPKNQPQISPAMAEFMEYIRAEFLESGGVGDPMEVKYKAGGRDRLRAMFVSAGGQVWGDAAIDRFDGAMKEYNAIKPDIRLVFLI